jgi:hypothetical protein
VTGFGRDGRGSIPGKGKNFLFFTESRPALGPTQPPIKWVPGAISRGVKRQGREADHSPPCSAEVRNGGAILPLSTCLLGIVLNWLITGRTLPLLIGVCTFDFICKAGLTTPVSSHSHCAQGSYWLSWDHAARNSGELYMDISVRSDLFYTGMKIAFAYNKYKRESRHIWPFTFISGKDI